MKDSSIPAPFTNTSSKTQPEAPSETPYDSDLGEDNVCEDNDAAGRNTTAVSNCSPRSGVLQREPILHSSFRVMPNVSRSGKSGPRMLNNVERMVSTILKNNGDSSPRNCGGSPSMRSGGNKSEGTSQGNCLERSLANVYDARNDPLASVPEEKKKVGSPRARTTVKTRGGKMMSADGAWTREELDDHHYDSRNYKTRA